MVDEAASHAKAARRPRRRKFYHMNVDYRAGKPGFRLANADTVERYLHGWRSDPYYAKLPERPRFLFDKKLGRPPRDLEGYVGHWLISDGMKAVLEEIDRDAFGFISCEVFLPDGAPGPHRWLCTAVAVLDALDEPASELRIVEEMEEKIYLLAGPVRLIFREDVVVTAHVFRMRFMEVTVICDQTMKDACRQAGLKGINFADVGKK
ncbi:DUF1629 domain-containing protein [Bradyrhizobium sp. INPA03-11B]|uniref:imm11 family protein n=1 Tax=Bradyrhizobium sp. INPA03-11B TaxID=418598 RepID=UPI00338F8B69